MQSAELKVRKNSEFGMRNAELRGKLRVTDKVQPPSECRLMNAECRIERQKEIAIRNSQSRARLRVTVSVSPPSEYVTVWDDLCVVLTQPYLVKELRQYLR